MQVIKLISQVIADFASGEISQQEYQFDTDITLQQYLDKSFYKTATLIAASCKSAAAFSDVPVEVNSRRPPKIWHVLQSLKGCPRLNMWRPAFRIAGGLTE